MDPSKESKQLKVVKAKKIDLLGGETGEEHNEDAFKINEGYAAKYDTWRRKEEIQKIKDRYGDDLENEESSSSSESEDDEPEGVFDKEFLATLACLKSKDPKIYDSNYKFFKNESDDKSESEKPIKKKDKAMFLADYERETVIKYNGELPDEDEENETLKKKLESKSKSSYDEEQKNIKESFKKMMGSDNEDSDEDLLKPRQKTQTEKINEDEEYAEWLKGRKEHLDNEDAAKDMKGLQSLWADPSLDKDEKYLRDFILDQKYLEPNAKKKNQIPTYEEITKESDEEEDDGNEDEDFNDQQETFEHKFNFRFEEPDPEFIKRYPRTMKESLRRPDNKRRDKRLEVRDRKVQEKAQKREELKRLKALKRKEIMEKISKIKEITGNTKVGFEDGDLEADFNPDEHDAKMQAVFGEDYYEEAGDDEKPVFDDDDYGGDEYYGEDENWDEWTGTEAKESARPACEDKDFNMDADYVPSKSSRELINETLKPKKKSRRRQNKLKDALRKKKPAFNPDDETFEEYFDEYYKLDYEDIIDDLPCRFKYRKVVANDFGLSVDEVLSAEDKELNRWCSLKKTCQIRTEEEEKYDVKAYSKKANDLDKKKRILKSVYDPEKPEETEEAKPKKHQKNSNSEQPDREPEVEETVQENEKKKKKKRKNSVNVEADEQINEEKNNEQDEVEADVVEEASAVQETDSSSQKQNKRKRKRKNASVEAEEQTSKKKIKRDDDECEAVEEPKASQEASSSQQQKNKRKRKNRSRGAGARNAEAPIEDDRLKAYGINVKKFKNKLKYKAN